MNELSLFTGAGGGLLGTKLLGWRTIGYVEYESYCQKVIRQRIADGLLDAAPIFGDIRELDKTTLDSGVSLWYLSNKILEDIEMPAHRKDYNEAVKMYERGLSIEDVAGFYNITRQAMHAILKRRGVSFRGNKKYGVDNHFYRGGPVADEAAHTILECALKKGIITRKTHCEQCNDTGTFKDGRSKVQAHHDDYNKPLELRWLCQSCHHKWHKHNKAIPKKNGGHKEAGEITDVISAGFP